MIICIISGIVGIDIQIYGLGQGTRIVDEFPGYAVDGGCCLCRYKIGNVFCSIGAISNGAGLVNIHISGAAVALPI
jgi:hypothetical protein